MMLLIHLNFMITLFKTSEKNQSTNQNFNKKCFFVRIDIEHAFEMLKRRWQSLIALRLRIRNQQQYKYAVQWIIACIILHNILLKLFDKWKKKNEWWTKNEIKKHENELIEINWQQLKKRLRKKNTWKQLFWIAAKWQEWNVAVDEEHFLLSLADNAVSCEQFRFMCFHVWHLND